ncbi:MAG: hypothetical protein LBI71_00040 [Enterobacteriaceae bacterium]|jgi:hypothetical protein|nr:hypothetical protein [Enterobacteriaceae bacterium]
MKKTSLSDIALPHEIHEIPDADSDVDNLTDSESASEIGNTDINESLLRQDIEDRKADRALRKEFGDKAYKVAIITLCGWAVLLALYGGFRIFQIDIFPVNVMLAITTAVTLNVFAAFLGVIRGLFPPAKKP